MFLCNRLSKSDDARFASFYDFHIIYKICKMLYKKIVKNMKVEKCGNNCKVKMIKTEKKKN